MTTLLGLLSKYWKDVAVILIISAMIYQGYNWVYDRGVQEERSVWIEKQKKVEEFRTSQITGIEGFAKTNLEQTLMNQEKNAKELRDLLAKVGGKPLTNVDCIPSVDFTGTYNAVINRGNKK